MTERKIMITSTREKFSLTTRRLPKKYPASMKRIRPIKMHRRDPVYRFYRCLRIQKKMQLSDHQNNCAGGDLGAFLQTDLFDLAVNSADQGVFHFHGFHDYDHLASFNHISDADQNVNN